MRKDAGTNEWKRPNKKRHKRKRPAPCIPPVIRRPRTDVSPRKRSSGPLDGGLQCRQPRTVCPAPGFPRFRDFRARTAYADERDCSPSRCYYIMHPGLKQTRNWRQTQKSPPSVPIFSRWSSLLVKFHGGRGGKRLFGVEHHSMPQKRKNRIRRNFPDAAISDSVPACSG